MVVVVVHCEKVKNSSFARNEFPSGSDQLQSVAAKVVQRRSENTVLANDEWDSSNPR